MLSGFTRPCMSLPAYLSASPAVPPATSTFCVPATLRHFVLAVRVLALRSGPLRVLYLLSEMISPSLSFLLGPPSLSHAHSSFRPQASPVEGLC